MTQPEVQLRPNEQPAHRFPWETGGVDSESESEAAESLFEEVESGLEAVEELLDEKPAPKRKPPADDEDEESEESDESDEESDESEDSADEDEDDGDQEDEDEDDGSDESDEDEDSEDSDDEELFEVPLPNGKGTEKVTQEELVNGYLRTADYTRKRQRDAKEHGDAMADVRSKRETYDARLEKLDKVLREVGPKQPDAALRKSNPGQWAAENEDYRAFQAELQKVADAREEISEERKQELLDWKRDRIEEVRERLVDLVPEWTNPAVMQTEMQALGAFLKSEWGFSEDDLHNVMDHRLVMMARENMQSRQKTKKSKKRIEESRGKTKARLAPGSTRQVRGKAKRASKQDIANARKRAAMTGSVRDAARSIELELGDVL